MLNASIFFTSSGLTGSAKKTPTMRKFRRPLDTFDCEVLDCVYGQYPWDDWERDALAAGARCWN